MSKQVGIMFSVLQYSLQNRENNISCAIQSVNYTKPNSCIKEHFMVKWRL